MLFDEFERSGLSGAKFSVRCNAMATVGTGHSRGGGVKRCVLRFFGHTCGSGFTKRVKKRPVMRRGFCLRSRFYAVEAELRERRAGPRLR